MNFQFKAVLLLLLGICLAVSPSASEPQCPQLCSCERLSSRLTVDCSYRKLTSVPDFSMLQSDDIPIDINLDGNIFSYIIGTSFWYVGSRLQSLTITNNERVFKIGDRTFSQPHYNLKMLKLSPIENDLENDLKSILGAKTLERLYIETRSSVKTPLEIPMADGEGDLPLKVLHIHDSGVSFIGHMAMAGLTLRELGLSKNLLTDFPIVLWYMISESLEILYLDDNRITALKKNQFPNGCKLRKLFLQNNALSFIEEDTIDNCEGLETINLAGNLHLSSLDPSLFVHFDNLQLDVRSTAVTRFDFVASYQLEVLLAYNENRFCKCKEVSPYLLKFGSKLKGVCQHPDTKEKTDVHEVCSQEVSTFYYVDEQGGDGQMHVYKYDTEAQPSRFDAEGGLIKFLDGLFGLSNIVQGASPTERMRKRETIDEIQEDSFSQVQKGKIPNGNKISKIQSLLEEKSTNHKYGTVMLAKIDDRNSDRLSEIENINKLNNEKRQQSSHDNNVESEKLRSSLVVGEQFKRNIEPHSTFRDQIDQNDQASTIAGDHFEQSLSNNVQSSSQVSDHYDQHIQPSSIDGNELHEDTPSSSLAENRPSLSVGKELDQASQISLDLEEQFKKQDTDTGKADSDLSSCIQSCEYSCLKQLYSTSERNSGKWTETERTRISIQSKNRQRSQATLSKERDIQDIKRGRYEPSMPHVNPVEFSNVPESKHVRKFQTDSKVNHGNSKQKGDRNISFSEELIYLTTSELNDLPLFACLLLIFLTYIAHENLSHMTSFKTFDFVFLIDLFMEKVFHPVFLRE